jgi:hypothetical protein
MKEQVELLKNDYKAKTGRELHIFTYNGVLGVLMSVKNSAEQAWIIDFVPLSKIDVNTWDTDAIRNLTNEDDCAEEGEEITDRPLVASGNPQKLLVDCVWSTVAYNKSDEYVRQLLTSTDQYYDWTSDRTRMIDNIYDALRKHEREYNELTDEHGETWLNNTIAGLRKDWEKTCAAYEDPCGFAEFFENTTNFDELLEVAKMMIADC